MMMTSNTTQGTSTVTVTTGTNFVADFTASTYAPSVHEAVSGSTTERIMIFMTANVNHTFTVPAGGIYCDILMIGGGGGASSRGGGGAGACIVAIGQTLPAGSCVVSVGNGGSYQDNNYTGANGSDSFITVGGADRYRAKGGGTSRPSVSGPLSGGCGAGPDENQYYGNQLGSIAVSTNVVVLSSGSTSNIGPCISSTFAVLGNAGGNNGTVANTTSGSGGGIGTAGVTGGKGGDGLYQITLAGAVTPINFRGYFANGGNNFGVLFGGNYYIGGGGGGYDGNSVPQEAGLGSSLSGPPNSGSGNAGGRRGATGMVIIRYRSASTTTYTHTPTSTTTLTTTLGTPSIELVRGTQGDSNTDYKIGNYNGDFIVKSSTSSIDTDRFNITTAGNIGIGITNPAVKLQVVGGDFACSGDISAYYSDERLKTRLSNIKDPLEIIGKLNGFYYIPNDLARFYGITNMAQEIGLSAQEVNKVLPELVKIAPFDLSRDEDNNKVSKSGENYLTLSYDRLAPVFVEAIKELRCSNDDLNEKYNRLLERFVNDEKL